MTQAFDWFLLLMVFLASWLLIERSRLSQWKKTLAFAAIVIAFLCGSAAVGQEDAVGQPVAVAAAENAPAFATLDDDATLSTKVFRAEVAKSISEAAEKSETLSRGEKRRIQRVMRGGWWNESRKNTIIDRVAEKMHADGAIVVTPEGVQAAVDWDAILSFIEKLMPLILQLITLFGG